MSSSSKKVKFIISAAMVFAALAMNIGVQGISAATRPSAALQDSSYFQQLNESINSRVENFKSTQTQKNRSGAASSILEDVYNRIRSRSSTILNNQKPANQNLPTTPSAPSAPVTAQPTTEPSEPETEAPTTQSAPSTSTPSSPTGSSSQKMWGAYLGDSNASSFESLVGKKMDIQAYFYGWKDSFPSNSTLKNEGKTLFIFWEQYGVTLDQIISGSQDSYIKQFAQAAKAYGGPVMLAPLHEMNGNWDPWGGTVGNNTPAKVVSAWKHIHNLFADATNVKFVWAVNNTSVPNTNENAISSYYPGSQYVDYVGIDGFNFGEQWTFDSVFSSALSQVKGYNKPILISSTASATGTKKAAWITETLNEIFKDPSIVGFIWFNENKEQNWLVNSDPSCLSAFKQAVQQY